MTRLRHIPSGSAQQSFRRQIRLTPQLDNAFGQLIGMDLSLRGMLEKLALHTERTDRDDHEVMALIVKDANDFRECKPARTIGDYLSAPRPTAE